MHIQSVLSKKLKGAALSHEELRFFVEGVTQGHIEDFQASTMLAAMYIHGLTKEELKHLTRLMAESGDQLDLSDFPLAVDKHSSGGVGDKVTLVIVPLTASLGIPVAKMSGRGLGHTGGTIDKLESIPGFSVNVGREQFLHQLSQINCVITAQTGDLCYADKKLYAIRDLTGTVDSIPLIASSIMSKKIAAGAPHILLDVKCGSGAFMKTTEEAKELAKLMVEIGKDLGRKTTALVTDMSEPLGYAIGNSLEVIEAIKVLKGEQIPGLTELCVAVVSESLILCKGIEKEKAYELVKAKLAQGEALKVFYQLIEAQGGDPMILEVPERLPTSKAYPIYAKQAGYIEKMDSMKLGLCAMLLGAGRETLNSQIDYGAGILLSKKRGDFVNEGEILGTLFTNDKEKTKEAEDLFLESFSFSEKLPQMQSIIIEKIT